MGIMREQVPSMHHHIYFLGSKKEQQQLKFGNKYGPIKQWDPIERYQVRIKNHI